MEVTEGAVETSFDGEGSQRVLHKVVGSCSVLPQSRISLAATFSPSSSSSPSAPSYDMHWVWKLEMASGIEWGASALLSTLMGSQVSHRIDTLRMQDLAVVASGSTVRAGQQGGEPGGLLMRDFGKLQRGVSDRKSVV